MSINVFFIFILSLLVGMFGYFKPMQSEQMSVNEVPQFELDQFVIYEISPQKIDHFFEGKHGKRFVDRYEISGAKFTDNEKVLIETIEANNALYKNDVISLDGNVHYTRSDGLEFRSNEGMYDKKDSLITTDGPFVITKNQNSIDGVHLNYDLKLDTVSANKIRGSYQLN